MPCSIRTAKCRARADATVRQRRETVGVAVVRRRRKEEAMLEPGTEIADGAGELRLDAVSAAARRRGVVRFVEDEQASRPHAAEPSAHRVGVGRVGEEVVGHEEAAVRLPRVDAEAALAADIGEVPAVEHLEHEAEALI